MVAEHYPRLGFESHPHPLGTGDDATFWRLSLAESIQPRHFIEVQA